MIFANALRNSGARNMVRRWGLFAGCVAVAAAIVGWLIGRDGVGSMFTSYVTISDYRYTNHPGYYAVGLLGALVVYLAAYLVWTLVFRRAAIAPGPFGGDSLIAFTVGNTAINLLARMLPAPNLGVAVVESAALIVATWFLVFAYRRIRPKRNTQSDTTYPVSLTPGPAEPSLP